LSNDLTQRAISIVDQRTSYLIQSVSNLREKVDGLTVGGGTPGGSDTQVQYNNAGAFGGITGATTDGTTLTLVAPVLGIPASATLTNATGLPISTGVSGLGTGVATSLAIANNSAGGYSPIDGTATLTNKTIAFGSNTLTNVMSLTTAQSVTAGIKKTFQADATNAGIRLVGVTADPSSLVAGDIWFRSDLEKLQIESGRLAETLAAGMREIIAVVVLLQAQLTKYLLRRGVRFEHPLGLELFGHGGRDLIEEAERIAPLI